MVVPVLVMTSLGVCGAVPVRCGLRTAPGAAAGDHAALVVQRGAAPGDQPARVIRLLGRSLTEQVAQFVLDETVDQGFRTPGLVETRYAAIDLRDSADLQRILGRPSGT